MPPTDPDNDLPIDPVAATEERIAHIRQTLAFDAHEAVFGDASPLDIMRMCAWRLLTNGQWREAGLMADRIAPYMHERVPTTTIVHSSAVASDDDDAPSLPPPLLDRPVIRIAPGGLSILHNLDPAEFGFEAEPEPEPQPRPAAPPTVPKKTPRRTPRDTRQT